MMSCVTSTLSCLCIECTCNVVNRLESNSKSPNLHLVLHFLALIEFPNVAPVLLFELGIVPCQQSWALNWSEAALHQTFDWVVLRVDYKSDSASASVICILNYFLKQH